LARAFAATGSVAEGEDLLHQTIASNRAPGTRPSHCSTNSPTAGAVHFYTDMRRRLADELGVLPSAELASAFQYVLNT